MRTGSRAFSVKRALAALNHPNIAAIYGLENTTHVTALVMELVEGEDLSQHIARGAMPSAMSYRCEARVPRRWKPHTGPFIAT
jgi:serine/threonine protein kinase